MEGSRLAERDRELLTGFLARLRGLLQELLNLRRPLIPRDLQGPLEAAWGELEQERVFERAADSIRGGEYDATLRGHGLYGSQLALKVALLERAAGVAERDDGRLFRRRGLRKKLWSVALKAADVALGSAAAAVPLAAPIKEFKEAAEVSLEAQVPLRERWRRRLRRDPEEPALPA